MTRYLLALTIFIAGAFSQTAKFPDAVVTIQDLGNPKDMVGTTPTLTGAIDSSTLTWVVSDGSKYQQHQIVQAGSELSMICSISTDTLTMCARGFGGTTPAPHGLGTTIRAVVTSWTTRALAQEVKAIAGRILPARAGAALPTGTDACIHNGVYVELYLRIPDNTLHACNVAKNGWNQVSGGGGGTGDVVGPASAVASNLPQFSGTTGKLISDSGVGVAAVTGHIASTANPHAVTKAQVGLPNVPNVDATNAANIATGTLPAARLPNPTTTTPGGVRALACPGSDKVSGIGTDNLPVCAPDDTGAGGTADGPYVCATAGTSTAYTCTISAVTSYTNGLPITLDPHVNNGTPVTLSITPLGPKPIIRKSGNDPSSGELVAGSTYHLTFNTSKDAFELDQPEIVAGSGGGIAPITRAGDQNVINTSDLVCLKTDSCVILGGHIASGAAKTAPFRIGASDPATCDATVREFMYNTTTNLLKACNSTNVWTTITGSGGGGANPDGYYIVSRAANAPTNAQNIGLLSSGVMKITVSAGVATITTATVSDITDLFTGTGDYLRTDGTRGTPGAISTDPGEYICNYTAGGAACSFTAVAHGMGTKPNVQVRDSTTAVIVVPTIIAANGDITVTPALTGTYTIRAYGQFATGGAAASSGAGRKLSILSIASTLTDGACVSIDIPWAGLISTDIVAASIANMNLDIRVTSTTDELVAHVCNYSGESIPPGTVNANFVIVNYNLVAEWQVNYASMTDGQCLVSLAVFNGVAENDVVVPGWPSTLPLGFNGKIAYTNTNEVGIRMCNFTGETLDLPEITIRGTIIK